MKNQILLIDAKVSDALKLSKLIDEKYSGDWLFFDASNGKKAHGLFQIEGSVTQPELSGLTLFTAHKDFLKHLLGLFTPTLKSNVQVYSANDFKSFCFKINDLLNDDKKIFDHSRKDFWIWHESSDIDQITIGENLKKFLEIT